jgi:all-trans-retinol 13,14-reductase
VAVEVHEHRAVGVRLRSGSVVRSKTVVAAIHPKALLTMIPESELPATYRQGIGSLEETGGMLCTVALVDEKKHPALDYNIIRVLADPSHTLEGAYAQMRASGRSGLTRLTVLTGSSYDDWSEWHKTQTGDRGPAYRKAKLEKARRALHELASAIGVVDPSSIIDTWTPLTMRDFASAPRGGTYGVRHSISDGFDYLVLSRPPLGGLFLVGQNAISPGLLGTSLSVLRALTLVAGRQAVGELLAKHRGKRTGDAA